MDSDYINRMLYDTDYYASLLAASGIPPESLTLGADDIRLIDEAISLGKTEEPMIVFRGLTDSPLGIPLERITDNGGGRI